MPAAVLESAREAAEPVNIAMMQTKTKTNVFDVLDGFTFTDQNGKSVTGLRNKYGQNPIATGFGYGPCTDICPLEDPGRKALSEKFSKLVTIVIDVQQGDDKAAYVKKLKDAGIAEPIVVLFPENTSQCPAIAKKLGFVLHDKDPMQHTPYIALSKPGGEIVKRVDGTKLEAIQNLDSRLLNPSPAPASPAPSVQGITR